MKKTIFLSTIAVIAILAACKHHPDPADLLGGGGGGGTDPLPWVNPDPCDPDTVYFTNTIAPLLNSYCGSSDCHDANNPEEGISVASYNSIMNENGFVEPGDANSSELVEVLFEPMNSEDHMPPSDESQLTADQIDMITTWINQGALNNSCTADCDTTMVPTFSGFVSPLITAACVGCHDNSNPDGDLTLMTYDQISAIALDGRLISSLNGTDGYSIMPDNTTGIPQCQIDLIQEWIDAGAQND